MAAQQLLVTEGYAGLSMRAIAARVGISLSTVQHYYKSKEALVEALLTYVLDDYQSRIAALGKSMKQDGPLARFTATLDMIFEDIKKPQTYGIFVETWALAQRMPFAAHLIEHVQARERKEIFKLIRDLEPRISAAEYKLRAAMIVVQINGLLLQLRADGDPVLNRRIEDMARRSFMKLATQP